MSFFNGTWPHARYSCLKRRSWGVFFALFSCLCRFAVQDEPVFFWVLFLPTLPVFAFILPNFFALLTRRIRVPHPPLSNLSIFTSGHDLSRLFLYCDARETAAQFEKWRSDLGPIYMLFSLFGMRSIVVMSTQAIQRICIAKVNIYHRSLAMKNNLRSLVGAQGILLDDSEMHGKLRKVIAEGLTFDRLLTVQNVFLKQARMLVDRLPDNGGDILASVRISTFDVILESCFGHQILENNAPVIGTLREKYLECLLEPREMVSRRFLLQTLFWYLPAHWFGFLEDAKKDVRAVAELLCHQYKANPTDGLLRFMMDQESTQQLTHAQMLDNVLSFLAAGQATTSISVCWTLYLLAVHPEWQERLYAELQSWDQESISELDSFPILHLIVKESLRFYPPVLFLSRVLVESDTLDGYHLPKGTIIRIPVLAIQRSPHYWGDDADQFRPERWEKDDPTKRLLWCLFLFGSKGCVGQRFAILEIKAFVAVVVSSLKAFRKKEDSDPSCYGAFATPRGMKLYFEKRQKSPVS